MTNEQTLAAIDAEARLDAALETALAVQYHALGLRVGTDVRLPGCPNGNPSQRVRDRLRLVELQRPWVALVNRDGLPDRQWVVAGDTRAEVEAMIPRPRSGPNGPIDGEVWLREE